ncbi:phage tail assembly chaperone [Achromobacter marplatensis]|uniref:Phage tail assembly chaperone n=1 Tax=Achromobacter marplatensis TaxID=470868 RepID=A0AA43B009_9BURK|nr:phage tail assembly chaperone [Achromobacter marplatensis]MDH2052851.1 phage tail assembly chaperone [Achromobacter marplatensis]
MTFIIKGAPTIEAKITIKGQGREQQLNVTFRHKTRKEYEALMKRLAADKITTDELLLELMEKWDADAPLGKESLALLKEHQPGADLAIVSAYNEALTVERQKN